MNVVTDADSTIEILMIDDDAQQFESLKNYAAIQHGVMLTYARTLEEGLIALKNNHRILAIILDGKGVIQQRDSNAYASESFVHEALTQIAVLEHALQKKWPKCVLTAWYDYLIKHLENRVRVFDKKMIAIDEGKKRTLFEYLLVQTQDSRAFIIRQKYRRYFGWMDMAFMPADADSRFYDCLEKMEYQSASQQDFNTLRSLYETLLSMIHKHAPDLLPAVLFHFHGKPNLDWTWKYMKGWDILDKGKNIVIQHPSGKPLLPEPVIECCQFVKNMTNIFSHAFSGDIPQVYFKSAMQAFIGILEWYGPWVISRKN